VKNQNKKYIFILHFIVLQNVVEFNHKDGGTKTKCCYELVKATSFMDFDNGFA